VAQRYEAVAVRKYQKDGEERSAFTNIGVAWPMKDRDGYTLRLHCVPAPVEGEYHILLFPPKPKEDQAPASAPAKGHTNRDLDDEVPF
jgi:hypothetical protein